MDYRAVYAGAASVLICFDLFQRVLMGFTTAGVPLTTVSQSCGFNDYSNFYRCFRRFYGKSPRDAAEEQAVAD